MRVCKWLLCVRCSLCVHCLGMICYTPLTSQQIFVNQFNTTPSPPAPKSSCVCICNYIHTYIYTHALPTQMHTRTHAKTHTNAHFCGCMDRRQRVIAHLRPLFLSKRWYRSGRQLPTTLTSVLRVRDIKLLVHEQLTNSCERVANLRTPVNSSRDLSDNCKRLWTRW